MIVKLIIAFPVVLMELTLKEAMGQLQDRLQWVIVLLIIPFVIAWRARG